MSTRISKQSNNIDFLLPSLSEAIQNSLSSYFQKTLQKITLFLTRISQNYPNKDSNTSLKRYQDLSNQQITQRSYFLFHIYEGIISLYQFFKLIKVKEVRPSQFCIKKSPFRQFIQSLLISDDELAKLSRIKKEIDSLVIDYKRRILFMLYEAQVYIYQILLRIIVIKLIYEENEEYERQKQQIRHNYFYIDNQVKDKNTLLLNLGKLNKMKHIFKDINCISRFYHCQISISRSECNSKPQMYSLIYLLKIKLNSNLLALILQNCEFKCKQRIIQTFIHPFSSFIRETGSIPSEQRIQTVQEINEVSINPLNETSIQKIQYYENQVVERQEQSIINNQSNDIQIKIQPEEKPFIYEQDAQKSNQIQQQSKKQQHPLINQFLNNYEHISQLVKQHTQKSSQQKLPQLKKAIDISLLDLNYKRQEYLVEKPQQIKIKPKKIHTNNSISLHKKSLQQKMQQIPNRFTHAQCNFKYVMNSKISKRGQQLKKFQQQSKQRQGQILPQQPKIYFTTLKDDSQQSFLAEQTPVHKNRAYIKSNNQKP